MWVTQTYLGTVEPDAKVFVYYFFEDYNRAQRQFTEHVQRELEVLGEAFGEKVSLLAPNPRYSGRIEAEMHENMPLWTSLRGKLPGLFVSTVPLSLVGRSHESSLYIPFATQDPVGVAAAVQEVRRLAGDMIAWEHANRTVPEHKAFGDRLLDAIELKPGLWGFRIDLRRLGQR